MGCVSTAKTALIVGAGIGGLAAGVALQRAGWRVRVFEQADEARESGFGLGLAPNAVAALTELGAAEAVLTRAARMGAIELCRADGRQLRQFSVPVGAPAAVALRTDLHRALLDALGTSAIQLRHQAVSFADRGDDITVAFANGATERGDLLVGADGIHSVIRRGLHPQEPAPTASVFAAVRGVATDAAHHLGALSGIIYLDDGIEAGVLKASPRDLYWYLSILADDVSEPTADAIWRDRATGFDPRFRTIVAATSSENMRFDPLLQREPLRQWGAGRVTLLGDAAHPVLPHTGQGAAQALEDAVALSLALSFDEPVPAALRRYESVRSRRTERLIRLGPRLARTTTTRNVAVRAARSVAIQTVPQWLLARLARASHRDPHAELRRR
jgi:2-polyprenyl-6-methoxyphenol hydroxylase-like FAD-dependent oxidoreductase